MKNAIAKKSETLVTAVAPSEHMERAARINYYHEVGKQGAALAIEAAFRCGMELFQAKIEHVGTFEKWIEQNCEFSRITAYRYLSLVQKAISADDLPKLANGTEKARKSAIAEILATSDSKTVNELFCEYGVMTKTPSNLGGRREGAGRKRKDDKAALAKAAEDLAHAPELVKADLDEYLAGVYRVGVVEGGFGDLKTEDLADVVKTLKDVSAKAEAILRARS